MTHIKIWNRPAMHIHQNVIVCNDHIILTSHISRIWNGGIPVACMGVFWDCFFVFALFMSAFHQSMRAVALIGILYACLWVGRLCLKLCVKGLQIELNTGRQYCFFSGDAQFNRQVYEHIARFLAAGGEETGMLVDFRNRKIANGTPLPFSQSLAETENRGLESEGRALQELRQLMQHCKNENKEAAYALLEEIQRCMLANQREQLKKLYVGLIQEGLIQDCNNLGLHMLLNEIKTNIYQG